VVKECVATRETHVGGGVADLQLHTLGQAAVGVGGAYSTCEAG